MTATATVHFLESDRRLPTGHHLLTITSGPARRRRADVYFLERHPGPGRAYRLVKFDPAVDGTDPEETYYDVDLVDGLCTCKGQAAHGHLHPCKHLDALRTIESEDRLP